MGREAERKWVVITAAEVGRAAGMRLVSVDCDAGEEEEEEEEDVDGSVGGVVGDGEVVVAVVDVVMVVWEVEIAGGRVDVVTGREEGEEVEGKAVIWGLTTTVVVELWAPVNIVPLVW